MGLGSRRPPRSHGCNRRPDHDGGCRRWYKLGRTLLYGRLEDEASFSTVRRLVVYEDYMLHVMSKTGLNTSAPYGFAEITPECEYLLVAEFIDGAHELLDGEVDDVIIDDALATIRTLWDSGLAHRDIKPSNLLVRDGKVYLIDVAFARIRPTPWRQAVDLANMMLVLGLATDADRVYARALRFFSPDEIAEAFAATRGVTMPSQSRSMLRKSRRDLLARFRELAPKRRPISIQRWSSKGGADGSCRHGPSRRHAYVRSEPTRGGSSLRPRGRTGLVPKRCVAPVRATRDGEHGVRSWSWKPGPSQALRFCPAWHPSHSAGAIGPGG
jgi:tRNA A-37 threonylcarbamoyl transferase component Bud32